MREDWEGGGAGSARRPLLPFRTHLEGAQKLRSRTSSQPLIVQRRSGRVQRAKVNGRRTRGERSPRLGLVSYLNLRLDNDRMASTRLTPSLLLWIESLSPALPSLNELDSTTGKPKRVVNEIADLNDGVVLGDVVGEV